MKIYLAPLEGLTGYIYRNAYAKYFGEVDKYFTPFIASNQHGVFSSREKQDVALENNEGKYVVPQILTNNADDFIRTMNQLVDLGYNEVNLNLGCPSGTVVSKNKGSGFLAQPEALEIFLDKIFNEASAKISIKTRSGKESPEEFVRLLEIFNKYPMEELIIHPRVQKDYYKNTPNKEVFKHALVNSKNTVCYNGDIFTKSSYESFRDHYTEVDRVMLGRGILANPGLVLNIKHGKNMDKELFDKFHTQLLEDYQKVMSGDRNVLFKMKELWYYMGNLFEDIDKPLKKVKKCQTVKDYQVAVANLLENCELDEHTGFSINQSKKMT